ncbi:UDP-glucuronosyl/UDP-glucosyltransferase [Cynara cardunculus var. scolymus]|uniref:UDP-glucuronosyl/UDP-glucosyltransferase n=1 Tax=Cynara cardunculus var. scolymus TaxID=59895 RepID=A0A118JV55_CYNCS|nr:UDP-glucuronosyl/UDP-glucosyltransferase [Cynara cardunculus var. scolymus]
MINKTNYEKISCVIADECMSWAIHVAEKLGIQRATFWSAPDGTLATMLSIRKLIDDGIMDNDEFPAYFVEHFTFRSPFKRPNIPAITNHATHESCRIAWGCIGNLATTKTLFNCQAAKWKLCNSTNELESSTFSMFPNLVSVGLLLASNRQAKQAGHFWQEDSTCLAWLDQQSACSVIYMAFGSFTIFN